MVPLEPGRAPAIAEGAGTIALELCAAEPGLDAVVVPVEDAAIVEAMAALEHEAGLLVEPAGAAGLAAIGVTRERWRGRGVATVLCGSNR